MSTVAFGLLSLSGACSSPIGPDKELDYKALGAETVCMPEELPSTADWRIIDRGAFRYRVPPDFQQIQVQGIDSDVQLWAASELRFASYDYGWYSNSLVNAQDALDGYSACREAIGGYPAALIFGWDSAGGWGREGGPKYIVAGSWRNVPPGREPAMHLTMTTAGDRIEDRPILLAILRSVEFTP
jgi:hypothetical protein